MGKKLLFLVILLIAYLSPTSVMAQCPTSVSISANPGTTVCSGTSVAFTATPTGGSSLSYEWFIGSASVQSGTSNTFASTTLNNSDKIKVVVTSTTDSCSITSNTLTMTVNAVLTPSVSISASKTTICPGENITFNASPINGGNNPSYVWKIGTSIQSGSSSTFSTTALTDGQSVTAELTSNATCVSPTTVTSSPISITVKAAEPATPGTITGDAQVCPGIPLTYSIAAVANATSYEWTLPSGWSGTSTSNSISVTSGNTGSGNISVKAKNDCGTSAAQTFAVSVSAGTPNAPGTITGDTQVCPGIANTYSVAAVSGATEYEWTLPSGWSGSSITNSIDVTTGASGNGNITVKAKNNCGTSAAKTLAVSVKPGTPAVPSTITGTASICPGTTNTYSIATVANATSYEWTLPNGWTGTSSTTSINATSNSSGGDIKVKAINDCGTSADQTLAITIKAGTPAQPVNLSGSNTVCPNTSEIYSVTNDATATEYIWTLPNGWTGTSSTSTITVNTGNSGSGNISVKAKNDCGTSTAATIAVNISNPAPVMSGTISGPAIVCTGSGGLSYTIPAITNATSYEWSIPSSWSISAGATSNSITAVAGASGNISVKAINSCGESAASAIFAVSTASGAPATPSAITTNLPADAICPPATGITFNVPTVTGATSYNWTLPTGWEITSGANTNAITVKVNSSTPTTNNASVSVKAVNICGESAAQTHSGIVIDTHVIANIGEDKTICKSRNPITINGNIGFNGKLKIQSITSSGTAGTISGIPNGNVDSFNFTYTPSQNDIDTKSQVTITLTTQAPNGACGPGVDDMIIFIKPDPTASISGTSTICTGNATDITFTATPNSIVTYKKNNGTDQTIAIGASGNTILNTGALTANTTYSLVSVKHATAPDCSKSATGNAIVTITPKPTATISYSGSPYNKCINTGEPVTLTGTGAFQNGKYSSTTGLTIDADTGEITPSNSTAGTYIVTYETLASGGCEKVSTTTEVIIEDIPTISLSYSGTPFCSDDASSPLPTLGGTGAYQGGGYSAEAGLVIDAASGAINIVSSNPGSYNVVYSVTPASGCTPITQSTPVIITEKPQPSISYSATKYCKSVSSAQTVNLTQTGTATISGGNYTSTPAGLDLNATSGAINPSLSDAGDYIIRYTIVAANGCEEVFTETPISITEVPSALISYEGPFCQSNSSPQLVSFSNTVGAFEGGEFSVSSQLTINPTTGEITPSSSQSGTHTINYRIPAAEGCEYVDITTTVTITSAPTAILSYNGPFCTSETSPQAVTFSDTAGNYQNGTFSGTNGLSIDSNGNINPSTSSPGDHTVSYTILGADGCEENIITTEVEILEQVAITTQPSNVGICSTQAAEFEVIASGSNLSYQWYKDGSPLSGKTSSILSFNNATSTNSGDYYVVVSGTSPCSSATSETVTLNVDEEIIIIKPAEDETFCENDVTEITFEYIAHANGAELTFEWIKDNVVLTDATKYTFERSGPTGATGEYSGKITINNLAVTDNGAYAVQIKGPDSFTCSEATSKTFTLSINDQPDAPTTADLTYCQGDVASALTATGTNLKWYQSETGDDLIAGTPTPLTDTVGTTSYWVSQTPNECESPRSELIVIIKEKPAIPITTETLSFCLDENVTTPLEATASESGNTINWYNAVDATTPLNTAPTPDTGTDVTAYYWVSQTKDGCESDRAKVTITINPLPILTVDATDATICSGSSTTLNATGATTYLWTVIDGTAIESAESTKASPAVSPIVTTTYLVTGTSDKGCTSTAEVTVNVDEQSAGGVITPSTSTVCISGNSGTLSIAGSGYVGDILRWESSLDNGGTWSSIDNTSENLSFTNLTQNTLYRVAVKSGICDEAFSTTSEITVDPVPVGGKLLFNNNNERIYLTCESPSASSLSPISISDHSGTIVSWKYRKSTTGSWTTIQNNGSNFTGTTLSASQIFGLGVTETIVFQVEMSSGSCTPNALSQTAILSVIPSDIEPTPVTIDPDVLCFGDEVTLQSSTGYTDRPNFLDQGAFDNASITNHGWRVRRNGNSTDIGFDTDANNTRPDRWKRATRHQFTTANIDSPYNTREDLYISSNGDVTEGNKGFAIVSSNNSATLETPVFAIGGLDQAILTWDQMYNLTPGASIKVEISTDGGNTYNDVLYSVSTQPEPTNTTGVQSGNFDGFANGTIDINKIKVDLGYYMGQQNLRIRFSYVGLRLGDVWAIDNIDIPDGPRGVELAWYDYTDELNPIFIGNDETETWTPSKIGWNEFEVRTKLLLDSSGQACQSIENYERVEAFAFDKYVSTAVSTAGSCGSSIVQLNGKIEGIGTVNGGTPQGEITSFPTLDGYTASWVVTGPSGYVFSESHFTSENGISPASTDPNAFFTPGVMGTYSLTWTLTPTAVDENNILIPNDNCPPDYTPVEIGFVDCTTLDFDGIDDFADLGTNYTDAYSIEAWFRPEATSGTIISKRDGSTGDGFDLSLNNGKLVFSWNSGVLTSPQSINANDRWYHAAVSFNGTNAELFIDGISVASHAGGAYINSTAPVIVGAIHDSSAPFFNSNHFSGWIEEVRIWNTTITEKQVQFMMNQRLYNNGAQMGVEIPMDVPEGLTYNDLAGYYQLIATDILAGGLTADLATTSVNGILHNMETLQENTAPLPYTSRVDGQTWATDNTWTHFDVWDAPNSNGVDGTPIDWNIVRTSHDIKSGGKDITVLGLLSDTAGKMLSIANPSGAQDETNNGQFIRITHYLHLDGNMDLVGESQLLQDEGSLLAEASAGYLERDQQGTLSSFNYNYWTAPVSTQGAANNSGFTVRDIMWDGTDSNNPKAINYRPSHPAADGAKTNPITKSDYWIFKFVNRLADDYDSWQHIGSTGFLKTGEGHTMKGVSGVGGVSAIVQKQNYVYRGKPNNGDITLTIDKERNYLVGNPYPSAIDSKKFILDNLNSSTVNGATNTRNIFDGTLYFWDHFSGATHILREYIGGYAVLNLTGGAPAIATDDRINSTAGVSTKTPEQFIPVSQGFFVNTGTEENISGGVTFTLDGGPITFKNSQREFARESSGNSIFLRPENITKTGKEETKSLTPKIRISFKSPKGYNRQLLVGADANTTNGFDIGYDAPMIEYNLEDMYWLQAGNFLVIQGVPDFGKDQVLPIGIRIDKAGEFKIKIDTLENINDDHTIYLRDIALDTIHDIRAEAYIATSEAGEITDRFELIFHKESQQDPIIEDPIIIDDLTDISLLHSYTENEMMVLNPQELRIDAIYLYDLNGKLLNVFDDVPSEKEIVLKIANFSDGIYVLKMHTDNEIVTRKIIIRK